VEQNQRHHGEAKCESSPLRTPFFAIFGTDRKNREVLQETIQGAVFDATALTSVLTGLSNPT
jgi:hypothetical protein